MEGKPLKPVAGFAIVLCVSGMAPALEIAHIAVINGHLKPADDASPKPGCKRVMEVYRIATVINALPVSLSSDQLTP